MVCRGGTFTRLMGLLKVRVLRPWIPAMPNGMRLGRIGYWVASFTPAAEVVEPGVIKHIEGNRFSLGEPDGSKSERAMALSAALSEAGLKAPVRPKLRDEIWVKLWGNLSFNPISALTHATLDVLCTDAGTREVARNMMLEAQQIAEALGVKFPIDVDRRIDGGAAVGAHRTSMLQDLDLGRPMEIDAPSILCARTRKDYEYTHPNHRYGVGSDPTKSPKCWALQLTFKSYADLLPISFFGCSTSSWMQ